MHPFGSGFASCRPVRWFVGLLFSTIMAIPVCPLLMADEVILKNSDRLSGAIVKGDGKVLTLKSEFAGTVNLQWDAVQAISSNEPLHLHLKDGQFLVGVVSTSAQGIEVETKEAGKVVTTKSAIDTIHSKEEEESRRTEVDRLRNPRILDVWSGFLDTGLSQSQGNSRTITFNLAINATRTTKRDKVSVHFTSLYAKNSTSGETLLTADTKRGGISYNLNLNERSFVFGSSDLEADQFQKLDLRSVLGGGFGVNLRKTDRVQLDIFGGGDLNKEFFSTGLSRSSAEMQFGQEFFLKLTGKNSLREKLTVFPNLNELGEARIGFDSSLITNINRWLGWQFTVSDRYLSNPVPGTKKNDLLLTTGLRLTLAR